MTAIKSVPPLGKSISDEYKELQEQSSKDLKEELNKLGELDRYPSNVYNLTDYKLAEFILSNAWSVAMSRVSMAFYIPDKLKMNLLINEESRSCESSPNEGPHLLQHPLLRNIRDLILEYTNKIQDYIVTHFTEVINEL